MLQPHLLFISHGAKSPFVSPEGEESLAAVPLENDVSQSRPNCVRFPAANWRFFKRPFLFHFAVLLAGQIQVMEEDLKRGAHCG
jgi:hypothetical protein